MEENHTKVKQNYCAGTLFWAISAHYSIRYKHYHPLRFRNFTDNKCSLCSKSQHPPVFRKLLFLFTIILICLQMLLLGKKASWNENGTTHAISCSLRSVCFHRPDDVDNRLLHTSALLRKIISLVIGCLILAFGICLEVIADVTMISAEYTIQFATLRFKKSLAI